MSFGGGGVKPVGSFVVAKESPSYPEVFGEGITFCVWEREGSVASDFPVSERAFKFQLGVFLTAWDRVGGASRPPIPGGDRNPSLILLRSCYLALKIVIVVNFKPDPRGIRTWCCASAVKREAKLGQGCDRFVDLGGNQRESSHSCLGSAGIPRAPELLGRLR